MIEWMVAAPASGSGKTVLTCALLTLLKKRGLSPCVFKCGPDYIDPMFHRTVLGVASHNLDLFLADKTVVQTNYIRYCTGHGAAIIEGVMGFYDGQGGTTERASTWHVADTLDIPVLLVVRPKGASLTLAAQIKGLHNFRKPSHIAGIFLNDCNPMLARSLIPMLEKETGIPVIGYLPHLPEAILESRHLGLCTAGEIKDLSDRITSVAEQLEQALDWQKFVALGQTKKRDRYDMCLNLTHQKAPIAVAQDEAFCFTYAETLDVLQDAGAELRFFSPIRDNQLPEDACGINLPGGYPELYAQQLAENEAMRHAVQEAVKGGLPTVAECGGFLYLGQRLQGIDGAAFPMAGVLPGTAVRQEHLVRFGYSFLTAPKDSLLFRKGEKIPIHEFHYWDSSENGNDLLATKPLTGKSWSCGFVSESLYAAFPHLYFAGYPRLAERLVQAAVRYKTEK